jgi:hypothetical protein
MSPVFEASTLPSIERVVVPRSAGPSLFRRPVLVEQQLAGLQGRLDIEARNEWRAFAGSACQQFHVPAGPSATSPKPAAASVRLASLPEDEAHPQGHGGAPPLSPPPARPSHAT